MSIQPFTIAISQATLNDLRKTLKAEEVYLKQYQSFAEAEANSEQCIEEVYNTKRLHSSLEYVLPVEFETSSIQGRRC